MWRFVYEVLRYLKPKVESSRTHFEVLGLGLEASSPRKLPCPRLEDSTIFEPLEFRWKMPKPCGKSAKIFFLVSSSRDRPKKHFEDLFRLKSFFKTFFLRSPEKKFCGPFFWRTLASVSLVLGLGLERVCPWPWLRIFFVSSTSPLVKACQ